MLVNRSMPSGSLSDSFSPQPDSQPLVSNLIYRSTAAQSFSEADLQALLPAARARNHAEGLTGLVLYDKGQCFQWLEGPAEGLARVWNSVRQDSRHTNIEILRQMSVQQRIFGEWDMRFLNQSAYRNTLYGPALGPLLRAAAGSNIQPLVPCLVKDILIPELLARHPGVGLPLPNAHPKAHELAELLTGAVPMAAVRLLADMGQSSMSSDMLFATVIEPAARHLGDCWLEDACSELEVTMALGLLQSAARGATAACLPVEAVRGPVVLVAPAPSEPHLLGAALDAHQLACAGWDVRLETPACDNDLRALVSATWIDALDLALSPALTREDALPRLARTIAQARAASCNPDLVVLVSGRMFFEHTDAGHLVGADAASASSMQIKRVAVQALARTDALDRLHILH